MDDLIQLRKITMHFEEIYHDGGPPPGQPLVRAAILAMAHNPYAGRYVEDLMPFMEALRPLGLDLARRLVEALGGHPQAIQYGKAAIVGSRGRDRARRVARAGRLRDARARQRQAIAAGGTNARRSMSAPTSPPQGLRAQPLRALDGSLLDALRDDRSC